MAWETRLGSTGASKEIDWRLKGNSWFVVGRPTRRHQQEPSALESENRRCSAIFADELRSEDIAIERHGPLNVANHKDLRELHPIEGEYLAVDHGALVRRRAACLAD